MGLISGIIWTLYIQQMITLMTRCTIFCNTYAANRSDLFDTIDATFLPHGLINLSHKELLKSFFMIVNSFYLIEKLKLLRQQLSISRPSRRLKNSRRNTFKYPLYFFGIIHLKNDFLLGICLLSGGSIIYCSSWPSL